MTKLAYRPEIDGLRAIAVIPVILFHMGYGWIRGGFLGVDVFFVISGFLITSILYKELECGEFSFSAFWSRRARRILPALILVVGVSLLLAYPIIWKPDLPDTGKQAIAALLSVANIYFWHSQGDYWGVESEQSPFLQTWSLSVEEQFYLLMPIAMYILYRLKRALISRVFATVIALSLLMFLYAAIHHPVANFYLLPTRSWELASGCLLATTNLSLRTRNRHDSFKSMLSLLALGGLIATYLLVDRLGSGVIVTIAATVIILALSHEGPCKKVLSNPAMTHIGKISYSLYLWHWPVLVYAELLHWNDYEFLLFIPIYVLALATYQWVEKPTRRREGILGRLALCYGLTCILALALLFSPPFYDTSRFAKAKWIPYNCHPDRDIYQFVSTRMASTTIDTSMYSPTAYRDGGIIVGDKNRSPSIVVLGDSHGCMWSDVIATVAKRLRLTASMYCMDGVSPFVKLPISTDQKAYRLTSQQKSEFDRSRLQSIASWNPRVVIIAVAWNRYQDTDTVDLLNFLEQHDINVLLLEQPPVLEIGDRNLMQHLSFLGIEPKAMEKFSLPCRQLSEFESGRGLIRRLSRKYERTDFLPTYDLYGINGQAVVSVGRDVVYLDDNHLVAFGSHLAAGRIERAIEGILEFDNDIVGN